MSNNDAPNSEPQFAVSNHSASNMRPKIIRDGEGNNEPLFYTVADLVKKYADAPKDLVPGYFSRALSMIQGKAGSGKSIIALELAAAYSTGSKFLGEEKCIPDPERPNVAYFDQDNFSHEVLVDRLKAFGVDETKFIFPTGSLLLDDPSSYNHMAKVIKDNKVGLVVLDSAHAFHKLKDRRLDQLRDGFKALIDAGTAVVILSHITKSGSADDSNSAEGSGLPAACDYVWGTTEVDYGEFRMKPVKVRHAKGRSPETVMITFNGESRPEKEAEISLEDKIVQFIADAGAMGTNVGAIRDAIGGSKDLVQKAIINLGDQIYRDGKQGRGNHIWDLQFKLETLDEEITPDIEDDFGIDDSDEEFGFTTDW
jgi:hypothetical protein